MAINQKLYLIEWIDSYSIEDRWEFIKDIQEPKSVICVSVGYIIKKTKENIMIAPHISDIKNKNSYGARGCLVIPKLSIIKKHKLKSERKS